MKKFLLLALLTSLSVLGFACSREADNSTTNNNEAPSSEQANSDPADEPTQTQQEDSPSEDNPNSAANPSAPVSEMGTITNLSQGDLMCYVDVTDGDSGETYTGVGATFEVCEQADTFLNQNSKFVYTTTTVNDCESNEPCGQTKEANLISQVVVIGEDWQTMDNGEWTLTLGRWESWDGVNNSGDVTYYGCDRDGNCLYLEEGKVICRDGTCSVGWSNGNYNYVVSTPISEDAATDSSLTVTEDGKILMEANGFQIISSSSI